MLLSTLIILLNRASRQTARLQPACYVHLDPLYSLPLHHHLLVVADPLDARHQDHHTAQEPVVERELDVVDDCSFHAGTFYSEK